MPGSQVAQRWNQPGAGFPRFVLGKCGFAMELKLLWKAVGFGVPDLPCAVPYTPEM